MPSKDVIVDSSNLFDFYFKWSLTQHDPNRPQTLKPYVSNDCIEVVPIDERRGRGMIAKEDLPAGTCLFVIPPTVAVSVDKVLEQWRNEGSAGTHDAAKLETVAEDILLEEMKSAIEKARNSDAAVANSFLVLEGYSSNTFLDTIPSLDCLLALDQTSPLLQEESSTVEDLRHIVRRNAFGPDFVTYSTIVRNIPKQPRRILGLYPLADMMNHSCQPNTVRVYVGEYMVVHTSVKVAAGDEIVTSYVPPTFSYPQRHASLQHNHGFVCACHRCQVEAVFWDKPMEKIANLVELQQSSNPNNINEVMGAIPFLEDEFLPSTKPNELQRSLRLGFTPLYVSYLNQALLNGSVTIEDLLRLCMQLHFGFVSCNPSSTEHLSILHLGYELIGKIHSKPGNDQSKTLPKLRFWTEQLKQACMTRYGSMGHDVDGVRRMMQHTRLVLRTPDGMQRSTYAFI
jgi:hypothetical protein